VPCIAERAGQPGRGRNLTQTSTSFSRRLFPSPFDTDYYLLVRLRRVLVSIIARYLANKQVSVFDHGCGDSPYRPLFRGIASQYLGGDIPGNPDADIVLDASGCVPCGDDTFDVILSIQVLEHVADVSRYLSESRRLLKKNGLMILTTHGWWTHHPFPHDYWRWTREGLLRTLHQHRFEVIEDSWIMGILAYSCQLRVQCWRGILENTGLLGRGLLSSISFLYQKLMHIADNITPGRVGRDNAAIYVMVARRAD
jgi:SAM-dependent methyltransferase